MSLDARTDLGSGGRKAMGVRPSPFAPHTRMPSQIHLSELSSAHLPEPVPYAVITPPAANVSGPLPLCLVLMGGGGSRQSLVDCQPLFDAWWAEGALAPMVFATPSAGMSYYLEDPEQGVC